jgi:carboxyl-terminal processing protease
MGRIPVCCTVLVCCTSLLAAPRRRDARPIGPPLSHQEAEQFALQLKITLDLMTRQYTRPVERPALITAALKGIYEAAGASIPAGLPAAIKKIEGSDGKVIELITQAREQLGNPPALRGVKALEAALWAALRSLDPYCFLITSEAYDRNSSTARDGVGVELDKNVGGFLRIKAVTPGGPAQQAGVRPGDQITHLGSLSLEGKLPAYTEALWGRLSGMTPGRPFRITLLHPGQKASRRITLQPRGFRAETVFGVMRAKDDSWDFMLDGRQKIGYLRVGALKFGTAADLQAALDKLQKAGMRGLVLDLRWCPGGLLDEAVEAASLLVGDRTIATIDYRDGRKQTCSRRQLGGRPPGVTFRDFPLVVLVNGETQGGGELIAAAIQDTGRGALAGQRTVGKGSVQNSLLSEQGGVYSPAAHLTVRLSIGVFTRLTGKNLQRFTGSKPSDDWGVRPDPKLEFAVSRELSRTLRDQWLLHVLRPAASDEATAMDDPARDPQREFALKALRELLEKKASK